MDQTRLEKCQQLIERIKEYCQNIDEDLITKALEFSQETHKEQLYISGIPYFEHCLRVANVLVDLKMDYETIIGGILHAITIDTDIDKNEIREKFGENINSLVKGLSQISELQFRNKKLKQEDKLRNLILSIAKDIRVIIIKLADKLENMRAIDASLENRNEKLVRGVAEKAMAIYVPLAHRLGISMIKQELEDLSFKFLDREKYENIRQRIAESREQQEKDIEEIISIIRDGLVRARIQAQVTGRTKSIYSIHKKMVNRKYSFDKINDILAIRIIVNDGLTKENRYQDCYAALDVVQNLFEPVKSLYSDYIQQPRDNGYQAIHVKVIYQTNLNETKIDKIIEVQIRTRQMHEKAETGIAAHWLYKEGKIKIDVVDEKLIELRQKILEDAKQPDVFLKSLKTDDLFTNEIYVFSPDHDLWQLQKDSTPVDFAFHVHTDVGFHCIGAKVNGKMVPLNHKLKSGDMIEIITSNNQHPNKDWLKFVKTSKAKNKIKKWLKEVQLEQSYKLGQELLHKSFEKFNLVVTAEELEKVASHFNFFDMKKFYAAVGRGDITANRVIRQIAPDQLTPEKTQSLIKKIIDLAWGVDNSIKVSGLDNLLINFGKCCHPLPGDRIVGFVTKGRGVAIHRADCKNVPRLLADIDRNIDVQWAVNNDKRFKAKLNMIAENNRVFLRDVTESLASMNTNIVSIDFKAEDSLVSNVMVIEVLNVNHLNRIMNKVRKIKGVISVNRIDSDNYN